MTQSNFDFQTNARGGWIVPANTNIPATTVIPDFSVFGDRCEFGDWCEFGNWCKFGDECIVEGMTCQWLMTAGNIDGSGRQVLIVSDGDRVIIRAGCFRGTEAEFVQRARAEGKHVYAAVIPAMIAARASAREAMGAGE